MKALLLTLLHLTVMTATLCGPGSPARSKTLVGRILPISQPIAEALARQRARRDPDSPLVFHRAGIPVRRWRTAWRTACQAAGVPTRFLHDCRRTAARNLIRASVPERVAMLLTGHKTRAIFDRYNIIHEQELLDAGDQLVAYLAQQAQAPRGRAMLLTGHKTRAIFDRYNIIHEQAHPASRHTAREAGTPAAAEPATPPHKAAHTATGGASDDSCNNAALEFDESWQRASSIPGPPAALLTNPTSRFFADLISQDSFSGEILLTDRFGRLVAASGQTSDYVQADEDWWTGAFGDGIRGRLFVSGVGYDESAQTEAIAIAVPVTTEDSVVGVIKVITDIRAITTLVSGMRIGVTGNATLVRPNGSIVLSGAGPSAPPADFFASGVLRQRLGDVPSGTLSQLSFSAPATNGEMRLVGVASSQLAASYPSLDWLVAVSQAEDELFGPVDAHAQWLLLMLALAAITMLFLAILFSRQLAAPPVPDDTHLSTHPKISRTD